MEETKANCLKPPPPPTLWGGGITLNFAAQNGPDNPYMFSNDPQFDMNKVSQTGIFGGEPTLQARGVLVC